MVAHSSPVLVVFLTFGEQVPFFWGTKQYYFLRSCQLAVNWNTFLFKVFWQVLRLILIISIFFCLLCIEFVMNWSRYSIVIDDKKPKQTITNIDIASIFLRFFSQIRFKCFKNLKAQVIMPSIYGKWNVPTHIQSLFIVVNFINYLIIRIFPTLESS